MILSKVVFHFQSFYMAKIFQPSLLERLACSPATYCISCHKSSQWKHTVQTKTTVHQVITMLATSKNILFPGPNHQCWWPFTLIFTLAPSLVLGWQSNCWVISTDGLQVVRTWKRTFLEVGSMVVTWWIVATLPSDIQCKRQLLWTTASFWLQHFPTHKRTADLHLHLNLLLSKYHLYKKNLYNKHCLHENNMKCWNLDCIILWGQCSCKG